MQQVIHPGRQIDIIGIHTMHQPIGWINYIGCPALNCTVRKRLQSKAKAKQHQIHPFFDTWFHCHGLDPCQDQISCAPLRLPPLFSLSRCFYCGMQCGQSLAGLWDCCSCDRHSCLTGGSGSSASRMKLASLLAVMSGANIWRLYCDGWMVGAEEPHSPVLSHVVLI